MNGQTILVAESLLDLLIVAKNLYSEYFTYNK